MKRTQNSIFNMIAGVLGQSLQIVMQFVVRTVFISTLSVEYLGVNGLFTNILSILALGELGIGLALNQALYKPAASDNYELIAKYLNFYKKVYRLIGLFILIVGLILTPFLEFLIKGDSNIDNIKLIYILYLLSSGLSYFFVYKKAVIEAYQKAYIVITGLKLFKLAQGIIQIIVLLVSHDFLAFLIVQVIMTVLGNIWISNKANRLYPFINDYGMDIIDKDKRKAIFKTTFAISLHRIGSIIVNNTDNLIISTFIGLESVGKYSNYALIILNLTTFITMIFSAFTASIGNLAYSGSTGKLHRTFKILNFVCYWLYGFISIELFMVFNDFVYIWLGKEFQLSNAFVYVITINFYLVGMRKTVLTYRDALGLFWYDRYKPIFEIGINLLISLFLVTRIGIVGVFCGTIVSNLLTSFWVEPVVLFKYGLEKSSKAYFFDYFKKTIVAMLFAILIYYIASPIEVYSIMTFILKGSVVFITFNVLFVILYYRNVEFNEVRTTITMLVKR